MLIINAFGKTNYKLEDLIGPVPKPEDFHKKDKESDQEIIERWKAAAKAKGLKTSTKGGE